MDKQWQIECFSCGFMMHNSCMALIPNLTPAKAQLESDVFICRWFPSYFLTNHSHTWNALHLDTHTCDLPLLLGIEGGVPQGADIPQSLSLYWLCDFPLSFLEGEVRQGTDLSEKQTESRFFLGFLLFIIDSI